MCFRARLTKKSDQVNWPRENNFTRIGAKAAVPFSKTCWRLVTASGLSEQQRIADAFFAEHLIPARLDPLR
jgi:hypothetical protein